MAEAIERVGDSLDLLGESPVWSTAEAALYWVDVRQPRIRRHHPSTGASAVWDLPAVVGSIGLGSDGRLIAALRTGVILFDPQTGASQPLADPQFDDGDLRFNDGRVDRQGRFWVGSMNDRTRAPIGVLYRVAGAAMTATGMRRVGCPNSLCWSSDSALMYYADSNLRTIFVYDFDPLTGEASNEKPLVTVETGVPDGAIVDSEGCLWCAIYGAGQVIRYRPDGTTDRVIQVPVTQPTSCTLGGDDLRTLYITTASQRLDADAMREQPMAGGLLQTRVEVPGLPEPLFHIAG